MIQAAPFCRDLSLSKQDIRIGNGNGRSFVEAFANEGSSRKVRLYGGGQMQLTWDERELGLQGVDKRAGGRRERGKSKEIDLARARDVENPPTSPKSRAVWLDCASP